MFISLKLHVKNHKLLARLRFTDYLNFYVFHIIFVTIGDVIVYICYRCSIRILHVYI